MCLPLDVYVFTTMVLSECSLELVYPASRANNSYLSSLCSFIFLSVLSQGMVGSASFWHFVWSATAKKLGLDSTPSLNFSIRIHTKRTTKHHFMNFCARISNFLKISAFNSFGPPLISHQYLLYTRFVKNFCMVTMELFDNMVLFVNNCQNEYEKQVFFKCSKKPQITRC